jgi:branched-chain amino acid transport system ATP-binding protein
VTGESAPPALRIEGVTKRFGGLTAIARLDMVLPERSISSVIGPNGAGKTTLFNCITGFYTPEEGRILLRGTENLVRLRPDDISRLGVARTYQNIRLFPDLTAIENIMIGLHARLSASLPAIVLNTRATRREEEFAISESRRLLDLVGLAGKGDLLARNLPYGDQRRLEIGRALATEPSLLLLDEPTCGMNPHETSEMIDFIRRLRADLGITICLIEHDMRVVMSISEQITVMDFGQKIAEGTPEEVRSRPEVIEAYLGSGSVEACLVPPADTAASNRPGAPDDTLASDDTVTPDDTPPPSLSPGA